MQNDNQNKTDKNENKRGFARLSKDERIDIASKGGKASHLQGTGHEWTSEEAAKAGRKGGKARAKKRNK